MINLTGKTRAEIAAALAGKTRAELVELIHGLVTFERLLSARQIAEASGMDKREVLADMRAGRFVDPIFGRGFFCRALNSVRVSASAANAWRHSWFVPVVARVSGASAWGCDSRIVGDSIPGHKKESARQTDLNGKNRAAKARARVGLSFGVLPVK